jgi:hypothetical protein
VLNYSDRIADTAQVKKKMKILKSFKIQYQIFGFSQKEIPLSFDFLSSNFLLPQSSHSLVHPILAINPLPFKYLLNNSQSKQQKLFNELENSQRTKFAYNQLDCHKSSFFLLFYFFWRQKTRK